MSGELLLLRELRDLLRARDTTGMLPATEVAQLLGFSAPSGFSHWFRAHFGCTLTQWRKQATGLLRP